MACLSAITYTKSNGLIYLVRQVSFCRHHVRRSIAGPNQARRRRESTIAAIFFIQRFFTYIFYFLFFYVSACACKFFKNIQTPKNK